MPPLSWEKALYDFLVSAFGADDLRRWIFFHCRAAYAGLPEPPANIKMLAFAFVGAAQKLGVLDAPFFEQLAEDLPERRAEVEAIRDICPGAAPSRPPPLAISFTGGRLPDSGPSHMAITLDRIAQWGNILSACAGPGHLLILVHGDREQNLDLFLRRIKVFVDKKCSVRHQEFLVDFGRDRSTAVTAEDWSRQVCLASPVRTTNLGLALAQAAREMAALFVLEHAGRPLSRLEEAHFDGFGEFFKIHVPQALATHRPANPVRFVLPIEHGGDARAVRDALTGLAKDLGDAGVLRVLSPQELTFPGLEEVRMQIHEQYPDLDAATWAKCESLHRSVEKKFRRTLRDLADPLDQILTEFLEVRAARRST